MIYFPSPDLVLEKGNENDSTGERTVEGSGIRHHTERFSLGPSTVYPEDSVFKPASIVFSKSALRFEQGGIITSRYKEFGRVIQRPKLQFKKPSSSLY